MTQAGASPFTGSRQRVLTALRSYLTDGEWDDIRSSLPRDVAAFFTV